MLFELRRWGYLFGSSWAWASRVESSILLHVHPSASPKMLGCMGSWGPGCLAVVYNYLLSREPLRGCMSMVRCLDVLVGFACSWRFRMARRLRLELLGEWGWGADWVGIYVQCMLPRVIYGTWLHSTAATRWQRAWSCRVGAAADESRGFARG